VIEYLTASRRCYVHKKPVVFTTCIPCDQSYKFYVGKMLNIPQLHFIKSTSRAAMDLFGDGADDEEEEDRALFYSQVREHVLPNVFFL
jgi:hypothetical protein